MDDFGSIRSYQELLCKYFEQESVLIQANEEIRREKENVNQLLQHLKTVYKERDEARDQIKKILNNFTSFNPQSGFISSQTQMQPSKANSSITESNSLSDTYTNYKSPNGPFFDIVSSPDSCNLGYANQHQQQHPLAIDQSCLLIDSLAEGKPLPQKGKLLKAVLEAGPLLKTLLVAGPLPSWRNPPPIQGSQIQPVSIRGCDSRFVNLGQANNNNKSSNLLSPQMFSLGSLMQFNGGQCFEAVSDSEFGLLGKRQKIQ